MTADEIAEAIHALGYGVTANLWRGEADVAVAAWPEAVGKPAAIANAPTLTAALEALLEKVKGLTR